MIDDAIELAVVQSDAELGNLFIAEALDHLGTIEAALLELDERPGRHRPAQRHLPPVPHGQGQRRRRSASSSVERVAHKVENLLDLARSGRIHVAAPEVDLVLRAVDVLTLMINDVGHRLAGQPRTATGAEAVTLVQQVEHLIARQLAAAANRAPTAPAWHEAASRRCSERATTRAGDCRAAAEPAIRDRSARRRRPRAAATTARAGRPDRRRPSRSTPGSSTTSSTWSAS